MARSASPGKTFTRVIGFGASAGPARGQSAVRPAGHHPRSRGLTTFELARIMGNSIGMIEAHYGALVDTAHDAILTRLDAVAQSER